MAAGRSLLVLAPLMVGGAAGCATDAGPATNGIASGAAPSSPGSSGGQVGVSGGGSGELAGETGGSTGQGAGGMGDPGAGGSLSIGSGGVSPQDEYQYGAAVTVSGRRILIGGVPLHIKGVCWNPVPKGAEHPSGIDFSGLAGLDIPLMQAAGINAVRTYEPLLDQTVLDQLAAAEIYLIQSVFPAGNDPNVVVDRVMATRDHPAILMWAIGNEWNYNGFYADVPFEQAVSNIETAVELIRSIDQLHPITTIYGELPTADLVDELDGIDVWGINAYRGLTFDGLIEDYAEVSSKPLFLAEFGADAWDSRGEGSYNPEAQAEATEALLTELRDKSIRYGDDGIVSGGTIFEWADEWWKAGNPSVQDLGGIAPGGGPHPDASFNEEWWGLVDVDRIPRPAYDVMKNHGTPD